jgi:hypothetical protein
MALTRGQRIALAFAITSDSPVRRAMAHAPAGTPLEKRFLDAVAPFHITEAPANLNRLVDHSSPDGLTHSTPAAFAAMDTPYVPTGSPCPNGDETAAVFKALAGPSTEA